MDTTTAPTEAAPDTTTAPDGAAVTTSPAPEVTAPDALDAGTSGQDQPSTFTELTLDDIEDPQARALVDARMRQLQADYTRKTTQAAQERREAQDALDLISRLEADESRDEALNELLDRYGLELIGDEPETTEQPATPGTEGLDPSDPVHARLIALEQHIAAQQQAQQQREQLAQQEQATARTLEHVDNALDAYADQRGLDELPDATRRGILTLAAGNPLNEHGLPNMELAIAEWEATVAAGVQAYIQSKDVPATPAGGGSGQSLIDLSDPKARLAAADAAAERAYARHA